MKRKLTMFLTLFFVGLGVITAQTQVRGTVVDETGEPVIGATIQIKGTSQGTVSDIDGNFTLSAPAGGTLIVSYVGMQTQEIPVSANVNAILIADSELLEDVVVIGYGSARKISSTVGSVVNVSSEEISDKPIANPLDALQGKVPGLQVFTSSGEPSQLSSVRLHGVGSLGASSTPLYVLDGVPIQSGTLLGLNPQDFESVTVLKDASATSIYGARAANGVIYITTKRGKIGEKATVSIKSQYGRSRLANTDYFEQMMNAQELTDFWVETGYRTKEQVNELLTQYPNDTQWYKYYYKDSAPTYQTDISISGGAGRTNYYISGSYFYQDGLAYRSDFDRYTLRANIDSRVNDWLRVGLNSSVGYDQYQSNPYGTNSTNRGLALLAQPFYSPYDEDGEEYPYLIPGWNRYNPKYLADKMPSPNETARLNTSGYVQINPVEGLTLKTQMGLEASDYTGTSMRYPSYKGSLDYGEVSESFQRRINKTVTNTVEYKFSPAQNHNLTTLLGHEFVDYDYESLYAKSAGHNDDRLMLLTNGTEGKVTESSKNEYAFLSYFGRIEYDFAEKYFLDLSLRNDASSRFGRDNRSAMFWSSGAMWHAKKENFLKDVNWLNSLTFKLSVGTSGNAEIGNYNSYALVGTSEYDIYYGTDTSNQYNGGPGWSIDAPGNSKLSWEEQIKSTFGVSFGLFDRIHADIEVYNRVTSSMLMDVPYPYTTGFAEITENVGKLQNRGVDINLNVDVWKDRNDNYITPYLNFSYNKDKVLELFQGKDYWIIPNTGVCYVVGQPVSFFYPIFNRVNPETGAPEWFVPGENIAINQEDPNNVTSTFNEAALEQNTGISRYAPINGGFGLSASYSGFYLQADFSFSLGKYLIVNDAYFFENPNQFAGFNQRKKVADFWKQPGDVTEFPAYNYMFTQFDSRMIENASFTRLKNLTLGYNVPENFIKKTNFFKQAKFFVTGRNLLTFTKFEGPDPEVDSNLTLGVNPNTKQISAGFELTF
jgi:TonB-linked SusC/RagA family outer membrane protein